MNRRRINALDVLALTLAAIGAINWGLSGAANVNLVRRVFGRGSFLERAVYIVVGLAGLNLAWFTARLLGFRAAQMGGMERGGVMPRPGVSEPQQPGAGQPIYPQAGMR